MKIINLKFRWNFTIIAYFQKNHGFHNIYFTLMETDFPSISALNPIPSVDRPPHSIVRCSIKVYPANEVHQSGNFSANKKNRVKPNKTDEAELMQSSRAEAQNPESLLSTSFSSLCEWLMLLYAILCFADRASTLGVTHQRVRGTSLLCMHYTGYPPTSLTLPVVWVLMVDSWCRSD